MSVGTLEEIIDDNHAIVSTSVGSEHYVSILSFVDKVQLYIVSIIANMRRNFYVRKECLSIFMLPSAYGTSNTFSIGLTT